MEICCNHPTQGQLTTNPANQAEPTEPQTLLPQYSPLVRTGKVIAVKLYALGLIICFFLPWLNHTGSLNKGFEFPPDKQASGFDFAQTSGCDILWLMPILAIITIWCGFTGRSQKFAAQLAGSMPLFILAIGVQESRGWLLFLELALWPWLALVLGIVLIQRVSPFKLAKSARVALKGR